MVAGSHCCDPFGFHFFRGRRDGLFEGRRHVHFQRDDMGPDQPPFLRLMRGTTRPIIVDWNLDGHADILLTYRGHKSLHVLYGGPDLVKKLLNLPVSEESVASEYPEDKADAGKWQPVFTKLEIPEFEKLVPPSVNSRDGRVKIGMIGEKLAVMERPVRDWIEVADWDGDGDVDEDGDGQVDEIEITLNSLVVDNSQAESIYTHQINVINLIDHDAFQNNLTKKNNSISSYKSSISISRSVQLVLFPSLQGSHGVGLYRFSSGSYVVSLARSHPGKSSNSRSVLIKPAS